MSKARLVELMMKLAPSEGYTESLLEGVTLMRANHCLPRTPALYEPSIVIVIQGRKEGVHGGHLYLYGAGHYLVLSVPLPFSTETVASESEPMLGLALRIDGGIIADMAMELGVEAAANAAEPTILYASPIEPKLEDATLRLLEALDSPVESKLLGPGLYREIIYRILTGPQALNLLATLAQNSKFGRIAKVLQRIHSHYDSTLDVASLANDANLSVPAFHANFKALTSTSPIQYLKAVRLHQARLLMIRSGLSASAASDRVGYQSASQFSREFKRMFGRSPAAEAKHLKQLLALNAANELHPTF